MAANYVARISFANRIVDFIVTPQKLREFEISRSHFIFENYPLLQSKIFISLLSAAARVDDIGVLFYYFCCAH